jgi:two-component system nitrate/nitrite response regulator NarL
MEKMEQTRLIIAEDHNIVRQTLVSFLDGVSGIMVVAETGETTALPTLAERLHPDLVLLDVNMPGPDAIETTNTLLARRPDLRIIVLSASNRYTDVVGLLQAGVHGYVLKEDEPEALLQAIETVMGGEDWVSPRLSHVLLQSVRDAALREDLGLTEREKDVLRLLVLGANNSEIADELSVAVSTVKNHMRHIFRKMDVNSRVEAAVYALEHHLIPKPSDREE